MKKAKVVTLCTALLMCLIQSSVSAATTTNLDSDGPNNGLPTYKLIQNVLGPDAIEAPDSFDELQHIKETTQSPVGNAFIFYLHRDADGDPTGTTSGNQRNEIKVYAGSNDNLKGFQGETLTYKWKFKVDSTMLVSKRFTHIFQLKSEGGDNDHPIVTFSGAKTSSGDELQIRYSSSSSSGDTILKSIDWSSVQGTWIEATVTARMSDNGSLSVSLKKLDGTTLASYSKSSGVDMWRSGNFIRPKWGIYRSLEDITNLNDAKVYFANFSITKQ
ncbi:hypothetical protein [Paenibacillus radicis (ex Xue et al. 2023)]|uniref:Polysaccharide lyase n=1 Tax=Paenibacillus radicis (ex Xue et al. 2023) TaxID=2972489 RepID=A0ABT1YM99_9BACL|nr:hypothetical protein [Paenibacillus radicis (ex Xue et al. 2023)]MCR8634182.1 hypothetical protein [Paenibacillus radicis (ex Xue et al. 2023)]